jgi:purine-cytosine permease-like protein
MDKQKRQFPFWIHIAIGVIWIILGATVIDGWQTLLWIVAGLLFITIGMLASKKQSKK